VCIPYFIIPYNKFKQKTRNGGCIVYTLLLGYAKCKRIIHIGVHNNIYDYIFIA